jgi:ribonucleoside-triphosphate reductase
LGNILKKEERVLRNLEDIEKDLAAAREALSSVKGTPAEVYSRIVGYYRSVRNWNKGKREEYGERRLFAVPEGLLPGKKDSGQGTAALDRSRPAGVFPVSAGAGAVPRSGRGQGERLLLFVRPACPACPAAKAAAGRLGIPVDTVNADTEDGLSEARRRNVLSTPTAILLTGDGTELGRALDSGSIAAFGRLTVPREDEVPEEAVS